MRPLNKRDTVAAACYALVVLTLVVIFSQNRTMIQLLNSKTRTNKNSDLNFPEPVAALKVVFLLRLNPAP